MNRQLRTELPDVFKAPSIARHNVVYAETRREEEHSMEGNLSDQDYFGEIPLVINQKNYERLGTNLSFDEWVEQVRASAIDLSAAAQTELGLEAIGYPRPVHGVDLIDLDKEMDSALIVFPYAERPAADATIVRKIGYASCFFPADCPVSNVVDPYTGALMQIHTGYMGLEQGTIASAIAAAEGQVVTNRSVVYVSPHAQSDYVINQVNNVLYERFMADPFMADFVTLHPDGRATLDLTEATKARLLEAGFAERNIQVSPDDSLTDPSLFSQSSFLTRGVNGRNGMILGKSDL